jgi:hypothetical protein
LYTCIDLIKDERVVQELQIGLCGPQRGIKSKCYEEEYLGIDGVGPEINLSLKE